MIFYHACTFYLSCSTHISCLRHIITHLNPVSSRRVQNVTFIPKWFIAEYGINSFSHHNFLVCSRIHFFFKLSHLQFPKCSKRIAEGRPHTSTCDTLIVSPTQSESNYLNGSILLDAWRHCYGCRLRWVVKILPSHTPAMLIYIPLLARIGYTGDLMMKS